MDHPVAHFGPSRRTHRDTRASCRWAAPVLALLLSACAAGPDYVQPRLEFVPSAFKEGGAWKVAEPQSPQSQQPWWQVYGDPTLNALVQDAENANQSIQQAAATYRQARAIADAAHSSLYPTVNANAGAARSRTVTNGAREITADTLGLSTSWQPDFWGGIRRSIEANEATWQASGDDLAAAHLSIQTTLVQNYIQLRIADMQRDLYATTIEGYDKALKLVQAQRRAGTALLSDVALAQSTLATAQAANVDLEATRAALEHAIAVLTGRAPANFSLPRLPADQPFAMKTPLTPVGVPSHLLERRPDIAAAERRVAAANANIGVARAAYYPALTLSASGGYSAAALAGFFDTPNRVWSLGAALAQTVFDGGLRKARDAQAVAAYDASVASYKQVVLTGFQQVEDNLANLSILEREAAFQAQAVQAGQTAERLALSQYRAGTTTYLTVITAQATSLTNQRTALTLRGRQLAASVSLISAIGGDFAKTAPAPLAETDVPTRQPSSSNGAPPSLAPAAPQPQTNSNPTT